MPVTPVTSVELSVYPHHCDASGRARDTALLSLLESARWEQLARGPGLDIFSRRGAWPVVRKANVEFYAPVRAGDRIRIETTLTHHGRTSFSLHQTVKLDTGTVVADADLVFVCLDRQGEPTPVPPEIAQFFGRRPSVRASETQHLAVRGIALAMDVQGDGTPILFIHGFPLDRTVWRPVMAKLTGWRRIAPDLRGMGLSDLADRYSMADYADDLAALLDALNAAQAVICGLSMGGYIAFEMLRRHRERVKALILCNTRAEADSEEGRRKRDEMIELLEREGPSALAETMIPKLLAPLSLGAMPQVVEHLKSMITGSPADGLAGALRAMRDRPDSTPLLTEIAVPTLVIAGRDDQLIPPAASRKMAEAIPNAQFTLIPDAGHLAPLEQPVATSRVIAEFLEAVR
jgi:pimeloyl-ACP methyl ester carboxylesterase/acyl-CoA thioesterase FadM